MPDSQITVVGNLTADPDLRFTPSGKGVCNLKMAVNRRFKMGDEWQEKVSFYNVSVWEQLGENAAASLKKGDRVLVTGTIEMREYEVDGQKRISPDITADEIGPSLRWASIEGITRNPKKDGGNQSASKTAGSSKSSRQAALNDEEPF